MTTIKSMDEKRIGFLLINTIAHAYHILPIAFELSYDKKFRVVLFVSSEVIKDKINEIALSYPEHNCEMFFLKPSFLHSVTRMFKKRLHPRVKNIIKCNIEKLLSMDALVMTDRHIVKYQTPGKPIYICIGHGAGDRKQGFSGSYTGCDYVFVPGEHKYKRMIRDNDILPEKCKVVGYPKFDIAVKKRKKIFFKNKLPTVIYNPHFNKNESSWFKWGEYILDYFKKNPEYNLIFAPHIILFAKKKAKKLLRYRTDNILIDVDGPSLSDMTYITSADIYLGDVSSQVYEFVGSKPRPCIFLNSQGAIWEENYNFRMWNMGTVINNLKELDFAVRNAHMQFSEFKPIQAQYAKETFAYTDTTSGAYSASVIRDILFKSYT